MANDAFEENNSFASAKEINSDITTKLEIQIGDIDWFKLKNIYITIQIVKFIIGFKILIFMKF